MITLASSHTSLFLCTLYVADSAPYMQSTLHPICQPSLLSAAAEHVQKTSSASANTARSSAIRSARESGLVASSSMCPTTASRRLSSAWLGLGLGSVVGGQGHRARVRVRIRVRIRVRVRVRVKGER